MEARLLSCTAASDIPDFTCNLQLICNPDGGFGVSIEPAFSPSWMTFLKGFNGVLAVPNIRGGNEYGESWHEGGMKEKKQNVIDGECHSSRLLACA